MSETEINLIDPIADLNGWPAMKIGWQIIPIEGQPSLELHFIFNETEYYGLLKVGIKDPEKKILTVVYTMPPDPDSAVDKARYSFDANISILGLTLNDDKISVDISVAHIPKNAVVTLSVLEMEFVGMNDTYSGSAGFSSNAEFKEISLLSSKTEADKNLYKRISECFDPEHAATVMLQSSLFPEKTFSLNDAGFHVWLKGIVLFLEACAKGNLTAGIPERLHKLTFPVDPASVRQEALFELFLTPYIQDGGLKVKSKGKMVKIRPLSGFPGLNPGYSEFEEQFEKIFLPCGRLGIAFEKGSRDKSFPEKPSAWAVRYMAKEDSGSAIGFVLNDKAAVVFAPKPFFNGLFSKDHVPVPLFDPVAGLDFSRAQPVAFRGIDLNVWLRTFFQQFDSLFDPVYHEGLKLKEDRTDQGTTFLEKLESQRRRLAELFKNMLVPAFRNETASAGNAQERFREALSERLSHFYEMKSVVELVAEINPNNLTEGYLSGQIIRDPRENKEVPEIRPAAANLPLHTAGNAGLCVMLYALETEVDCRQLPVPEDLSYQAVSLVNCRVEPELDETKPVSLEFFTKENPVRSIRKLAGLPDQVPLPLHRCPDVVNMSSLSGIAKDLKDGSLSDLLLWDFRFSYGHQNRHDKVCFTIYDHEPEITESPSGQKNFRAFDDLAQLVYLKPQMEEAFQKMSLITPDSTAEAVSGAKIVLQAYTGLVENFISHISVDEFWGVNLPGHENTGPEGLFSFTVKENSAIVEDKDDVVVITVEMSQAAIARYGRPELEIEGYETVRYNSTGSKPESETYYFTRDGKPLSFAETKITGITARTLTFRGLNIIKNSTFSVGAVIKRNQELVPGRPVNPVFEITVPTFIMPVFSMELVRYDAVDIAAFAPAGEKKYTLLENLRHLFSRLLQDNEKPELYFRLAVNYEYTIAGTGIPVQLPVLLKPPALLTDPTNPHSANPGIVESMAAGISEWLQIHHPDTENAVLKMDLSLYDEDHSPKPLLSLSGLYLKMEDVKQ